MRLGGDRMQRRRHECYGLTRRRGVSRRSFGIGLAALGCAIPIVPSANGQNTRVRRIAWLSATIQSVEGRSSERRCAN
jgi:hypothetical protein